MPKRTSRSSYKRARMDNYDLHQDIAKPASTYFKLWLIEEVKKYPILYKSLDGEEDRESCYDTWGAIVDSMEEDWDVESATVMELIDYCRETWKNVKRAYSRYLKGETSGMGPVIEPMRALFAEIDKSAEENNKSKNSPKVGSATAESATAESATAESATAESATAESATAESATSESATAESATSESATAESATAESAEEMTPPTTNDAAGPEPQQAATPGNPRSMGARSTDRAISMAIIDHLFDSLRSPAARTDVCNSLMQLVFQYRPNVLSDIIEYGARQPELFNVDWSGLPIPEDLCHEIWRRDAEEKLRKVYKITSSKRRVKKEH